MRDSGCTIGRPAVVVALVFLVAGCGAASAPPAGAPPPGASPGEAAETLAAGGAAGGRALSSGWSYRFQMTSPANERNAITERAVYLHFWPDTTRVWFQMENRLGDPIKVLWNDCRFITTEGEVFKVVHEGVPHDRRHEPQDYKLVGGLERYGDWLAPVDLMEGPSAAQGRGMRLLFPTDASAQAFQGKSFGIDFVLEIGGIPKTYKLVFKVQSVLPPR